MSGKIIEGGGCVCSFVFKKAIEAKVFVYLFLMNIEGLILKVALCVVVAFCKRENQLNGLPMM